MNPLARFIASEDPALAAEIQLLITNREGVVAAACSARTVGALLHGARSVGDERRRVEAAQAEIEKERREREAALARSKYLGDLARKEPAVWRDIDALVATKQPSSYDRAVGLLVDLRDAAATRGREADFFAQVDLLRTGHARKPSLIARIRKSGLR